jgi:hypothetical protein
MAKAIITITDCDDGVEIDTQFDPPLNVKDNKNPVCHHYAMIAVNNLIKMSQEIDENVTIEKETIRVEVPQ